MQVLALDIGGANIKAARGHSRADGGVANAAARSLPFALWKQPADLPRKLAEVASMFEPGESWEPGKPGEPGEPGAASMPEAIAVTMTGELCDCFESRREGVNHILDAVTRFAGSLPARVWLTEGRWASPAEARAKWPTCASANWHAQATWIARMFPGDDLSLLIDVGSTTTDIISLRSGAPIASGRTDQERLRRGELVYTGVRRTPLCALPLGLMRHDVPGTAATMAEFFATTQDVYVVLGLLKEEPRNTDTADGRPLTRECAANRLLRMLGSDRDTWTHQFDSRLHDPFEPDSRRGAQAAAELLAAMYQSAQIDLILRAVWQVMRSTGVDRCARVIVAGSGEFLARMAAKAAIPDAPVVSLQEQIGFEASTAACAWAMLHLWNPMVG